MMRQMARRNAPARPSPAVAPPRFRAPSAARGAVPAAPARGGHDFGAVSVLPAFPHQSSIERLTGRPVAGRAVHDPSLRRRTGVEALTAGRTTVFASAQPHPRVAAHEAAHLLQHAGATHDHGAGAEGHADAVAGRVSAGRPAVDLVGPAGRAVPSAVRPYTEMTKAQQTAAGEWLAGNDARIADNGQTVTTTQRRDCWADPALIASSEAALKAAGSGVSIKASSGTLSGKAPDGSGTRTLNEVEVKISASDPGTTNFYADCGRSSREVMGPTGTDTKPKGVYAGDTGAEKETAASYDPADYRAEIFAKTGRPYTVQKGDTLSGIAKKFLGAESRYLEIYNYAGNKKLIGPDPSRIKVDQVILIPPRHRSRGPRALPVAGRHAEGGVRPGARDQQVRGAAGRRGVHRGARRRADHGRVQLPLGGGDHGGRPRPGDLRELRQAGHHLQHQGREVVLRDVRAGQQGGADLL